MRAISWVLLFGLMLFLLPAQASAISNAPTRIINVVYDDSGSMIQSGGQAVDRWCQAKYAMEVFAALLGENDSLNIYVMSDYEHGNAPGPRLSLRGGDGQNANVAKIHNMLTTAGNTPFESVHKAQNDLASFSADEKWLVVLTDGQFQLNGNNMNNTEIDAFFAKKANDVNVIFLGMGADAAAIKANENQGLFYEKAADSKEILSKITGICTRIFNSDRLEVNASKIVEFDVPMGELTVFAQGANVTIDGIVDEGGKTYKASLEPVNVQYSETASGGDRYPDFVVNRNLKGSILTFRDDFPAGSYKVDVSGATTVEVYYKPNIEIAAYLTNSAGEEVTQLENLKAGEYTIQFGFVKAGTQERVNQSKLLGNVTYSAVVTNNGVEHPDTYSSGDKIYLEEGSLQIDAEAHYLEYNSVSTHLDYSIFEDKGTSFQVLDSPECPITKDGLDSEKPIEVQMAINGVEITPEIWNAMGVPTVSVSDAGRAAGYGDFVVEKSEIPGIYKVYPQLAPGTMRSELYENCDYTISYAEKQGEATWSGQGSGTLNVSDNRSWLERYLPVIIRWITIGIIAFIIAGYLPFFKKYLPKSLKKRPGVDCSPNQPGIASSRGRGSYNKRLLSTLIPYRAERGSIKFTPAGVGGIAPVLQVKAVGGKAVIIMNHKAYAEKEHITFNGAPIAAGLKKPPRITPSVMISVTTKEMTYTCIPSNK